MPIEAPQVKAAAIRAGFSKCGIARAEPLDPRPLDRMLALGAEADMAWLRTKRAERLDPSRVLPGARSVVALALSYHSGEGAPPRENEGEVARYARGRDYHAAVKKKLRALVAELAERDPEARFFAGCDVGPVMEKAWAERAGLGWVGKNGCLITPEHGSWVVLAALLTDRALAPDPPHPERCGSCTACMGACPTGAIPRPGLVDARLCISFWTIERRGEVPGEIARRLGSWAFGCDDCQTVCPWNRGLEPSADPALVPLPGQSGLDLLPLIAMSEEEYRHRYHGTALARARHDGLVRNGILLAGLRKEQRCRNAVRAHLGSFHPGVRAAARWALTQLDSE
ncbi:MAG TPA: tRNA epoxyqueuosine(34) reductase QueG [Anaeromyxobacter sp.]|nr:tRNA epoxyqueuosine(34) reductase QueG [Anaeromyxobacter sp.]